MTPEIRIAPLNDAPIRDGGDYVLYWMVAYRRTRYNFAYQRAIEQARELGKGLVVLEALRVDYRWASDRFHQFVLDGMHDNRRALEDTRVRYHAYLEPKKGAGRGLLAALAERAALVVTDDFPSFFLPRMQRAAARALDVRLEAVDSNGLLPMRAVDDVFTTAYSFRRALQKTLPAHLEDRPVPAPLQGSALAEVAFPREVSTKWPDVFTWIDRGGSLADLPIDHDVPPTGLTGGHAAAQRRLASFLDDDLTRYGEERNDPDADPTSKLSPYLHWGHLSTHEVFDELMAREGGLGDLPKKATGAREGWWGVSKPAEAFLDELVTWRELGFNMTSRRDDYDRFDSLPDWAKATLEKHRDDEREHVYTLKQLEAAETHDDLWNASQRQLVGEGRIHNYLRMLWGKKILEWSPSPERALEVMIELNNKYALDGRNPNSYSGIFWVLGRYDRAWGPEREIFGTVRYMTSENTARKHKVKAYLRRHLEASLPL